MSDVAISVCEGENDAKEYAGGGDNKSVVPILRKARLAGITLLSLCSSSCNVGVKSCVDDKDASGCTYAAADVRGTHVPHQLQVTD